MKKIQLGLILLAVLTYYACDKVEVDTTAPTLQWTSLSPSPVTDSVCGELEPDRVINIDSDDTLEFRLDFQDDTQLSQCKIDIHSNFDCHGHRGPNTTDWSVLEIITLSDTADFVERSYPITNNVTAGYYHFAVLVVDLNGNESSLTNFYTVNVRNLTDTIVPSILLTNPTQSTVNVSKGSNLNVAGTLSDDQNLDGGRLELVYFSDAGNKFEAWTLENLSGTSYNFNQDFVVPNTLTNGDYDFELRAFDAVGNYKALRAFTATVGN